MPVRMQLRLLSQPMTLLKLMPQKLSMRMMLLKRMMLSMPMLLMKPHLKQVLLQRSHSDPL